MQNPNALFRNALIYCLLILLVTNGKILELVKIPSLLEHYSQHKSQQKELSFHAFLFMHYVGDDSNTQDNSSDEQLPFKGDSEISGMSVDLYLTPQIAFKCAITQEEKIERTVTSFDELYLSNYNNQLFRPPVFC